MLEILNSKEKTYMNVTEILENKIDTLLKSIRRDLILKDDAYSQFVGYTESLTDFNIITKEIAKHYRLELAKLLY